MPNLQISKRVLAINPSPMYAITALAAKLKAEGKEIIGLIAGEPDFDTPQNIKISAIEAINKGFTKYTAVGGIPSLKQAIVAKFKRDNDLHYTPEQILVSCGGKQGFFNLVLAVVNPGDEVIISAPYWPDHPDIVRIAESKPVIVQAGIEQGFKLTPAQLNAAITPRTRMLVINSPNNPSGAVYTLDEYKALGEILRKHADILIVTDDIFEHFLPTETKFVNILNACPDLYPRTLVLNGVSKAYAMTGWRIGYVAGPKPILAAMENVQSQSTSNPTSFSQLAAETALNTDQSCRAPINKAFSERHSFVVNALNRIPGMNCLEAGGTFFAFPDVRSAMLTLHARGRIKAASDIQLSEYLLEQAGVLVWPGSVFGSEGYIRLSCANSMENLEQAISRISQALT